MKKTILIALIDHRMEEANNVQRILTEYGCYIKSRLGLHETSDDFCSESGLIILELRGDEVKHEELYNSLNNLPNVTANKQILELKNN